MNGHNKGNYILENINEINIRPCISEKKVIQVACIPMDAEAGGLFV